MTHPMAALTPGQAPENTVDALLLQARNLGVTRLDARVLIAHALERSPSWLHAHGDDPMSTAQHAHASELLRQRAAGQPVAYLTGQREFFGLTLRITPAVLDPRPDTETLVEWALELLRHPLLDASGEHPRALDLGTGSGAIALALAHEARHAHITATDVSPQALAVARANGQRLGLAVDWRLGDWLAAVQGQTFDLIVSNPPYLADDDPHLDALHAEPLGALVAGPDGLRDLGAIVQDSRGHLRRGGWLLLEHGAAQAQEVAALLLAAGFCGIEHRQDLAGHLRCTGARWP